MEIFNQNILIYAFLLTVRYTVYNDLLQETKCSDLRRYRSVVKKQVNLLQMLALVVNGSVFPNIKNNVSAQGDQRPKMYASV